MLQCQLSYPIILSFFIPLRSNYNYNFCMPKVCVFVLGDIGRSPRMQNHAEELSKFYQVCFLGYFQSSPRKAIVENTNIHITDLKMHYVEYLRKVSYYLYAIVKIVLQILQILYYLVWKIRGLDFVLIQNPPCIPNLLAIWVASFLGRYSIWIDFHNYGYTILNLNIKNSLVIWVAKIYEVFLGKRAAVAFCVSNRMKDDLKNKWGINAVTLYDRPRCKVDVKVNETAFLKKYDLEPRSKDELIVVSSTSWTKDQDFSILLQALEIYEKSQTQQKVRALITGKGPEKERYLQEINKKRPTWTKIDVRTVWLEADDYPVLLALCDLGVSLHYSSSGFDLPMKVVDMFASGIPVLSIHYQTLTELVKDGQNGMVFKSAEELADQLSMLVKDRKKLLELTKNAQVESEYTWKEEWKSKVIPYLKID